MTDQEAQQYKAYLLSSGMSDKDAQDRVDYEHYRKQAVATAPAPQSTPDSALSKLGQTVGHYALEGGKRALDFIPGVGRVLAAQAQSGAAAGLSAAEKAITGNNDVFGDQKYVVNNDDVWRMLKGDAPTMEEFNQRMGVREGPSVDLPLVGKVTARGVGSTLSGAAVDPLTVAGLKGSALTEGLARLESGQKLSAMDQTLRSAPTSMVNPVFDAAQSTRNAGQKMHATAFKNIDQVVQDEGAAPLSPLAWKEGWDGTANSIKAQAAGTKEAANRAQKAMVMEGTDLGVTIDPTKAAQPAMDALDTIGSRSNFADTNKIDTLKNWIKERSFVPDPEKLKAATQQYANDVAEYIPKFKAYLQDKRAYKDAVGAAADEAQPVIPGMVDDLQRVQQKPLLVELNGKAPSVMTPSQHQYTEQLDLMGLPSRQDLGLPGDMAPNMVRAQGSKAQVARAQAQNFDSLRNAMKHNMETEAAHAQGQTNFLDQNSMATIARDGEQASFDGLDLTPRQYVQGQLPAMTGEAGQTRMVLHPERPVRPEMAEVPVERVPLAKAVTTKTDLRKGISDRAMDEHGFVSNLDDQTGKSLAQGYQNEAVDELNRARPGLGDQFDANNQKLRTLIEAEDAIKRAARSETKKDAITKVDALAAASHPGAAVLKKGADLGYSAWGLTKGGRMLYNVGDSVPMSLANETINNPLLRQMFIEDEDKSKSPWLRMTPSK